MTPRRPTFSLSPANRLVALSALMLFLELALIRWLGENVVYLSYFTNLILLGSFLGIGLGFLASDRPSSFRFLPMVLLLTIAFVTLFPITIDRSGSDVIFFGSPVVNGLPIWVMLPLLFAAAVANLFVVGQEVAKQFVAFSPLRAYRLDILGSLVGIATFAVMAWTRMPPVGWAIVVAGLVMILTPTPFSNFGRLALAGVVVVLGVQSAVPTFQWSPYYRIETENFSMDNPATGLPEQVTAVGVNGIPHQNVTSVAFRRATEPLYMAPYEVVGNRVLENVLIIGAGTGTDVAIALSEGAGHVDAVEIDPALYELGKSIHPDRPYDDPRVDVHVTDGRAFMQSTDESYDLILFALPDSLTLVSGQGALRLESYLFTTEAITTAVGLLDEDGVFSMYNYYREQWLLGRLARTLEEASGQIPCVLAPGGSMGLAGMSVDLGGRSTCEGGIELDLSTAPQPVTDEYPFLYIRNPGIPTLYLVALGGILLVSVLAARTVGLTSSGLRSNLDLFLMGAAFLLLETKSVVQFALWFGTTWAVNAMVFGGVLLSVLAAIEVTDRFKLPRPAVLYGLLVAAVVVSWAISPSLLLELPFLPRLLAACVVTFSPIFLANLVFAQRFAESEAKSAVAFGANLLGAMVGGVLEYASLVVGHRSLALIVAVIYGAAFLWWRRHRKVEPRIGELVAAR